MNILLAFAPFLAFAVLDRLVDATSGLLAGAAVAIALLVRDALNRNKKVKMLEIGTAILFGGLAVYTLLAKPAWSIIGVRLCVDTGLLVIVLVWEYFPHDHIAAQLLEDGARVIINGRTENSVKEVVKTLNAHHDGNRALPLVADLGFAGSEKIAAAAYPEIDILVNNLGIYELSDFFSTSDYDWRRLFEVNVFSGVRLARTYFKFMLERNQGRVISISSEAALTPLAAMAHYSATKATQLSIERSLAELTKGMAVTVNSVLPGPTKTENAKAFIQTVHPSLPPAEAELLFVTETRPSSLIRRLVKPAEIANVVAFLASDRAAAINGASFPVEGGIVPTIA